MLKTQRSGALGHVGKRDRDVELVPIVDGSRLYLRQIDVVSVQVQVVEAWDFDFFCLGERLSRLLHVLFLRSWRLIRRIFIAIRLLNWLFLRNRHLYSEGASRVWVGEPSKLMRQDKVELLVLLERVLLSTLEVVASSQLLGKCSSFKHFACMVPPRLFIEAVVKVFVHILLAIVVPRLGVCIEVVLVDLRDGELFKAFVPGRCCVCSGTLC